MMFRTVHMNLIIILFHFSIQGFFFPFRLGVGSQFVLSSGGGLHGLCEKFEMVHYLVCWDWICGSWPSINKMC